MYSHIDEQCVLKFTWVINHGSMVISTNSSKNYIILTAGVERATRNKKAV